jgi:hypothetical protein
MHDPMLVLNMSIFNSADGGNGTFNQPKVHENARDKDHREPWYTRRKRDRRREWAFA